MFSERVFVAMFLQLGTTPLLADGNYIIAQYVNKITIFVYYIDQNVSHIIGTFTTMFVFLP